MEKVTVIITTYNEEKNIESCLRNAAWADAIMVVDAQSTDATKAICLKRGVTVFDYTLPERYHEKQLLYGIERSHTEWILALDADERLSDELIEEIKSIMQSNTENSGYRIPFKNIFFNRPINHGGMGNSALLRLYRRGKASYPQGGFVHEQMQVRGPCGVCKHAILHYGTANLTQYIEKINFYSTLTATKLHHLGKRITIMNALIFFVAKPAYYFILRYIVRKGFLDGVHGLIIAFLSAITVIMNHLKLWEMQTEKK
jgi:glycosyltransferase involved in cell wall biosynthesis